MPPARSQRDGGGGEYQADDAGTQRDSALGVTAAFPSRRVWSSLSRRLRRPVGRIARFLARPSRERRLLVRAALTLALIRVGLSFLPFTTMLRLTRRLQRPREAENPGVPTAAELARAVRAASRIIPNATCLTQALAGRILLSRAGHDSELRIGVSKHPERGFEAHAWLEHRGEIVLGGLKELSHFVPLTSLKRYLS